MSATRALFVAVATLGMTPFRAGSECLQPPQNVTVHIVDRNITLKWDWDNPCGLNATFSADYQEIPDYYETALDSLTVVSKCQNVVITECDLSSAVTNYFGKYNVNVAVESGGNRSLSTSLEFLPYLQAKIGPPEVQLESINGEVKINILHPEAKQAMWKTDTFTYKLVIWKNSSNPEEKTQDITPGETIHDLEPETTYCLKVKAHSSGHNALFSQIHCIQTSKAWVGLPRPTNLKVKALNMKCLLKWDNLYDGNVRFVVQFLRASQKSTTTDISKSWLFVPGCKNITSYCDFSSSVHFHGIYYLRVQAMNGHNKSLWSKELQFDPTKHNEIGPPSVYVNASEDSLYVFVLSSKDPYDDLSYRIWYWKNSSYAKEKYEDKSTPFTISNLTPSTLYCLQVQAFSRIYNKSSELSNATCAETVKGKSSYSGFVNFLIAVVVGFMVLVVSCGVYHLWKRIKTALFPKCTPPLFIENIGGKNVKGAYLLTSEEPTESCVIIDNSILNEVDLPDFKNHRQLEHVSQDSGNYSNDYGIFENKESHETPEQEAV